jgi:hypothetical protein
VYGVQVTAKYIFECEVLRYTMGWGNAKGNGGWNRWGSGGKGGKPAEGGGRSEGERYAFSHLYKERENARKAENDRVRELEKRRAPKGAAKLER